MKITHDKIDDETKLHVADADLQTEHNKLTEELRKLRNATSTSENSTCGYRDMKNVKNLSSRQQTNVDVHTQFAEIDSRRQH